MKHFKINHLVYCAGILGFMFYACKEQNEGKNETASVEAILQGDKDARYLGPCGQDADNPAWNIGAWKAEAPKDALKRVAAQAPYGLIKNFYADRDPSEFIVLEDTLSCSDGKTAAAQNQYEAACWSYPEDASNDYHKKVKIHIKNSTEEIHKYLLAAIAYAPIDFQIRTYNTCVEGLKDSELKSECEKLIPNNALETFALTILNSKQDFKNLYKRFGLDETIAAKDAAKDMKLQAFLFSESVDSFYCSKVTNKQFKAEFPEAHQAVKDTFGWSTGLGEENQKEDK